MTILSVRAGTSMTRRHRQHRRRHGYLPVLDPLEARCVPTCGLGSRVNLYQTVPSISPIAEMIAGPSGDLWFTRVQDLTVSHLTPGGNIDEFSVPPGFGQPTNLQLDASGNLWFTSLTNPPDTHIGELTPAGVFTEVTDFTPVQARVTDQATPPAFFLPFGHVNADGTGELIGVNTGGSLSFFALATGTNQSPYRPVAVVTGSDGAFW